MIAHLLAWRSKPNPLWLREQKQAARLGRTQWILLVLVLGISCLLAAIGGLSAEATTPDRVGQGLYQGFFSIATLIVTIGGPAIAANTIAAEREGKTWEAIQLTGLSAERVIRGKFLASFSGIALYIVALAPIGALPFLFGGVGALEVVFGFFLLFLYAAMTTTFGLALSSLMKSTRGALAVTLILSIFVGPNLFWFFGFGGSFVAHRSLPIVDEGLPIWLPLALARAEFGIPYVTLLLVGPVLALMIPATFFYEVALANLSDDADDRSTRLKKWYTVSTLAITAYAIAAPFVLLASRLGSMGDYKHVYVPLAFVILHLAFGALLMAGDPPFPSRRVRTDWLRRKASKAARFWGPSIARTATLHILLGTLVLSGMTLAGLAAESDTFEHMIRFCSVMLFLFSHFLFLVGLVVWLRSRIASSMAARLVAVGIVVAIAVVPWVFTAIAGIVDSLGSGGHHQAALMLGVPSPFYVFVLGDNDRADLFIAGIIMSALYIFSGIVLLWRGTVAARHKEVETLDREAQLDRALAEEDAGTVRPQTAEEHRTVAQL
jgi:ABC-type transport system involved in multi-copper enzyme maturation permease subunit